MESPTDAVALFHQGNQLLQTQQFAASEDCYVQAIALHPQFPQAHAQLGYLLDRRGEVVRAEAHFRQAIAMAPALAATHINLGALLLQQKRLVEAEASYAAALSLEPGSSAVWSNLGSLYLATKNEKDAEACLRKAMALDPGNHRARFNLAYLQLRRGAWEEGWTLFEARDWYAAIAQQVQVPRWQGEPLQGKSLLLCFEAGHGDVIHFIRYATLLKARGAQRLTLICHPALTRLMRTHAAIEEVISFTEAIPVSGHDYWMPLLSAPYHFYQPQAPIYAPAAYLQADPALCRHWAPQLPAQGLRVGLVWCGNPAFENDRDRSLPGLQTLLPLWQVPGVAMISLQKGVGESQAEVFAGDHALTCLGPQMQDFADAAAIVSQLDLVISVDTAMAHLAGALGKPCWVLLPDYMTDWRWGTHDTQGTHSAWYPDTLQLFRQGSDAQWQPVIQTVLEALQARLSGAS
jgi:Tfp pilus assembly protein PilF